MLCGDKEQQGVAFSTPAPPSEDRAQTFMGTNAHGSPGTYGAVGLAEVAGAWVRAGDWRSGLQTP